MCARIGNMVNYLKEENTVKFSKRRRTNNILANMDI